VRAPRTGDHFNTRSFIVAQLIDQGETGSPSPPYGREQRHSVPHRTRSLTFERGASEIGDDPPHGRAALLRESAGEVNQIVIEL